MKLRLRSTESKETLKIEAPNSCTLPQLKQILSQSLPNSPTSASIHLSLNRRDELQTDGVQSLQSLGIASGDLIFFSLEQPMAGMCSTSRNTFPPLIESTKKTASLDSECSTGLDTLNTVPDANSGDTVIMKLEKGETLDGGSQVEETSNNMEVDNEENEILYVSDEMLESVVDKSFSVPAFLRKVFMKELGDDSGRHHKLITIAVHAVILESGFVGFDKNSNMMVNGFQLRTEWPSSLSQVALYYTMPGANKNILLKFQSLGKFINVYGTLENGGSGKKGTYRLQLNEDQLVPFLNVVWANCGVKEDTVSEKDGVSSGTYPEKEVFNFWRTVKDSLALPLLIDLCEEAGLKLPPCFMRLPTEMKLKILESLPGIDIARVCCVCSELQYLGSSDDLWKMKFGEEFSEEGMQGTWKKSFAMAWNRQVKNKLVSSRIRASPYWPAPYWPEPRRRRYPNPFMVPRVPRIVGGDYDLGPVVGDDLQNRIQDSVYHQNVVPSCNLGVRGRRYI